LSGLGHAVMDHLGRYLHSRFAGHKHNSPPVVGFHARQVVSAQADAAHHVHFEEPHPVVIGDLLEWLGLENPEVVHQYVDSGIACDCGLNALRGSQVGGQSDGLFAGRLPDAFQGRLHPGLGSAIYDHLGAFTRERFRDGIADAGRGSRDECDSSA
jgi:hypothetical protein